MVATATIQEKRCFSRSEVDVALTIFALNAPQIVDSGVHCTCKNVSPGGILIEVHNRLKNHEYFSSGTSQLRVTIGSMEHRLTALCIPRWTTRCAQGSSMCVGLRFENPKEGARFHDMLNSQHARGNRVSHLLESPPHTIFTECSVTCDVPRSRLLQVLKNFDELALFVPGVKSVRVFRQRVRHEVISEWTLSFNNGSGTLLRWKQLDQFDYEQQKMTFSLIEGDLGLYRGECVLVEESPTRTRCKISIAMRLSDELSPSVPVAFLDRQMRVAVKTFLLNLRKKVHPSLQWSPRILKKCANYQRAELLKNKNAYFYMRGFESACEPKAMIDGRIMLMFSSNNYLGLATHPKVKEAAKSAIEKYGSGTGSSRILSGNCSLNQLLEERIADFLHVDSAVVFATGYMANVGFISGVTSKADIIFCDRKVHASILDGCKLSGSETLFYKHKDPESLERILKYASAGAGKLIVTEGVFSMDGTTSDLPQILKLRELYNAAVMLDDNHGIGVIGATGRGATEYYGVTGKVDIVIGSLSKAFAGIGGFVAGNKRVVDYLKHTSRPFVFSTSLPPVNVASSLAALDVIEKEPERIFKLQSNARFMRRHLRELGFNVGGEDPVPIIPILIGDELKTYEMTRELDRLGVFVNPVAYPAVKRNECRIRVTMMATHELEDIIQGLEAFRAAGRQVGVI